jgi:hypothetical protein
MKGMSDIWKMIITALVTFAITATTLWFAMIKEHQAMCGIVESVRDSQSKTWQAIAQHSKDIAGILSREEIFHDYIPRHSLKLTVQQKPNTGLNQQSTEPPHTIYGIAPKPQKEDDMRYKAVR